MKNPFRPPVDFVEEMDRLQYAREAKEKAIATFPTDQSTWSDDQWAIYDQWDDDIPDLGAEKCICRGLVAKNNLDWDHPVVEIILDPPPRHHALPKTISISGWRHKNSNSDCDLLNSMQVGDHATIRGFYHPPTFYIPSPEWARDGEYFRLALSRDYLRKRGY